LLEQKVREKQVKKGGGGGERKRRWRETGREGEGERERERVRERLREIERRENVRAIGHILLKAQDIILSPCSNWDF
jgi:hypothetical protein